MGFVVLLLSTRPSSGSPVIADGVWFSAGIVTVTISWLAVVVVLLGDVP